jgi:hypothetical protein
LLVTDKKTNKGDSQKCSDPKKLDKYFNK